MNTLLLTWCIKPKWIILSKKSEDLILNKRINQYINALLYYITKAEFNDIVFCDNSNFDDKIMETICEIATFYGKNFEYITYNGNKSSSIYGYGFSECEIIDYAVENSEILKNSEYWYKITWRYILKDINKLINKTKNSEFYFHKQGIFDSWLTVSTSFFKISNKIYKDFLLKKHIELYKNIYISNLENNLKINWSIPVEKIWYILLRDFLKENYKQISYSVEIYYLFPSSLPKRIDNNFWEFIRKTIYFLYYLLWIDILFSKNHLLYDSLNYYKKYKILKLNNLIK